MLFGRTVEEHWTAPITELRNTVIAGRASAKRSATKCTDCEQLSHEEPTSDIT